MAATPATRPMPMQLSPIVRGWLAFAALGTGLIHLALAVSAPLPLAVAFGAIGFVEFAWGVVSVRSGAVRSEGCDRRGDFADRCVGRGGCGGKQRRDA